MFKDAFVVVAGLVPLLGWAPDDDREVFTPQELIEAFSIDRLSLSAARFDLKKIQWLNGQHIRRLDTEVLRDRLIPILEKAGFDVSSRSTEWFLDLTAICQEKLGTLNDIVKFADFFFAEPTTYEEKPERKHWKKEGALSLMERLRGVMETTAPWSAEALNKAYHDLAEELGLGLGKLIHPTRLGLTGKSVGPGLFELAELLGKETCIARMERAIDHVRTLGEEQS